MRSRSINLFLAIAALVLLALNSAIADGTNLPTVTGYPTTVPQAGRGTVSPIYPDRAALNGMTAVAIAEFTVTDKGSVSNVHLVQGTGIGFLDFSVTNALMLSTFSPARTNGKPFSATCRQEFRFAPPPETELAKLRKKFATDTPWTSHYPSPPYPDSELRAGHMGGLWIKARFRPDGWADDVALEKSSGWPMLDLAAMLTVFTEWRGDKTMSQKTNAIYRIPIEFALQKKTRHVRIDYWR
jgi:TonB family protein